MVIDRQTNSTFGVFIEEEQSQNNETNHVDETVRIVAFEDGVIPCFAAGTQLLTPFGPRRVETLRIGDPVSTADRGPLPIRWIENRRLFQDDLERNLKLRPVCISAGALGFGLP